MRPGLILILLLMCLRGWGQGIMWEKKYGWWGDDELSDIVESDSGTFIAAGTRYSFGIRFGSGVVTPAVTLVKLTDLGDTLWTRSYAYGYPPRLCRGDSGSVYVAFTRKLSTDSLSLHILKVSSDGDLISDWTVSTLGRRSFPLIGPFTLSRTGALLITGTVSTPSSGSPYDMFVIKVEPHTGLIYFQNRYSDNTYTLGNWIEETPQHTYLASGAAGSRIWAIELDSNGAELRRQTFYHTATNAVFGETACVRQAPGGHYIASGYPLNYTPGFFFMGSFSDFSAVNQIWGGENTDAGVLPPHVQDDGTLVVYNSKMVNRYLTKLGSDSSIIWNIEMQSQINLNQPIVRVFNYQSDSSVIAVGSIDGGVNFDNDFYIVRIANMGVPYDPTQPVAAKPRYKGLPALIAYPNPSSGPVTVHTRSRQPLAVYSLSGQKRLEVQADPSGTTMLDLAGLPRGMYLLRQGENSIKLIKD